MTLFIIIFLTVWSNLRIYLQANNRAYNYGNTDFILSSVAVVERLWSLADKILDGARNNTTPIVVEALLFLHCNCSFWDEETIVQAYKAVQKSLSKKVTTLIDEDEIYLFEE